MPAVTVVGFTEAQSARAATVEELCRRWLPNETDVTVIGSVTAMGPSLAKAMLRSGALVLGDSGVEVWHRTAVTGEDPAGRIAEIPVDDVTAASLGKRGAAARLTLIGQDGTEVLTANVIPGEEEVATTAAAAIHDWLARHHIPMDDLEIETLGDLTGRAASRVRERARVTVDTLTLQEYRDMMDAAMGQVVEVLAVHEAEIARLQARVRELSEQLDDAGSDRSGP